MPDSTHDNGAYDKWAAALWLVDGELDDMSPQERAEAVRIECCPTCMGVFEHVLGCPEQDKAR